MRDWRSTELVPSKKKVMAAKKKQKEKGEDEEEESIVDSDEDEEENKVEDLNDWMFENPSIRTMVTYTLNSTKSVLHTKVIDGKEPYWSSIDDGMLYRGTVSEINQQILTLRLYNYASSKTLIGLKTVSLA